MTDTITATPILAAEHLKKSFGPKDVLADISFTAASAELVCIVGPSGVGKTTLLRCLAQLAPADSGHVLIDGTRVTRPPAEMAVVFQDYSRSLMPWMRVEANVALPLRRMRLSSAERDARVVEALTCLLYTSPSPRDRG